jgi:hypothetical protein
MILSTGYVFTSRGIIAIQGLPQTVGEVGRQLADDIGTAAAQSPDRAMDALELVLLAKCQVPDDWLLHNRRPLLLGS